MQKAGEIDKSAPDDRPAKDNIIWGQRFARVGPDRHQTQQVGAEKPPASSDSETSGNSGIYVVMIE